jgi:hypothetical protein
MEEAGNNLNIIILDACRNNPFARSFRSAEKGLAKMDAPTGSILAYSTAPGSVAADGTGRNGLYTQMLLKHMSTPEVDLPHLFMNVRKDVVKATGKQQVPWESSSLIGDFYFVKGRGINVVNKPQVQDASKVASIQPTISKPEIVYRDGSFEKYTTGVIYDKNTGLEWYAGPDRGTAWETTKAWVDNLDVDGGGWRMPTLDELKTLYKKGAGKRNLTPLFEFTGAYVWSGETRRLGDTRSSTSDWCFQFTRGREWWFHRDVLPTYERGFAVRSRR